MPDLSKNHPKNRWYDKEAGCTELVDLMRAMRQEEIREFAARLIIQLTERIQEQLNSRGGSHKSLGLPALRELYLARGHVRRWYDTEVIIKRAIGCFYSLPTEGLTVLTFKLRDTFELVAMYSYVCHQLGQDPSSKDLLGIARNGLHEGKEEAEEFLSELVGKDLYEALSQEFNEQA